MLNRVGSAAIRALRLDHALAALVADHIPTLVTSVAVRSLSRVVVALNKRLLLVLVLLTGPRARNVEVMRQRRKERRDLVEGLGLGQIRRRLDKRLGVILVRGGMVSRVAQRCAETHQIPVNRLDGALHAIFLSDHLAHDTRLGNLFLVCRSLLEGLGQVGRCELSDGRTDIERLDTLGPESLVAEERLDDGGL